MKPPIPSEARLQEAAKVGAEVVRTRKLLPTPRKAADHFGHHPFDPSRPERGGIEGDLSGKCKYHYPKPADPEKLRRIALEVGEMTAPWRRAEIERSGGINAKRQVRHLKDRNGRGYVAVDADGEAVERKRGTNRTTTRLTHGWGPWWEQKCREAARG